MATTPTVLDEVRAGDPVDHLEVDLIDALVQEGLVQALEPGTADPPEIGGLHAGERSVLSLALDRGYAEVIVDDRVAIRATRLGGLEPVSTPRLLLRRTRAGRITPEAFERALDRLVELRYHLSPKLYQRLLQAASRGWTSLSPTRARPSRARCPRIGCGTSRS